MSRIAWLATRDERAAARPSGPTIAEGQDPDGIVCIRIRARYNRSYRIHHDIVCFNARYNRVLLANDPAEEIAERAALLMSMLNLFPGIDWTRDHQILLGDDTPVVEATPDVDEPGFIPEEDATFGPRRPPVYATRPWFDNIPTLPTLERAA